MQVSHCTREGLMQIHLNIKEQGDPINLDVLAYS